MAAPRTLVVGHKSTTPDDFYGDMAPSEIRAYVANNAPADMWIRRARFRGGRTGGTTPRVRVVMYDTSGGGPAPDDRMYIFPSAYPSTRMDDARGGSLVTVKVAASDKGILVDNGVNYALAFQVNDADFRHNMIEAADISGENEQFYYKSAGSPPNPYGSSTVTTEGHMTLWLEGDENLAPLKPINVSPVGFVPTTTPLIEADFRDPNGTYGGTAYGTGEANDYDAGDYVVTTRVQVRRKSDKVSFWDHTYTNNSIEQGDNRTSRLYGNGGSATTLVRGTTYQSRVQHFDRAGTGSPLADSDWVDFTPGSLGVVTTTGAPTGKVNDLSPDVAFTWNHGTGLSANRARVTFYLPGISAPAATSSDVVVSVAPGASSTAPWSSMGISTDLKDGQSYYYTVEGRATDNIWSQPSTKRLFTTDKAPGVPTNISPPNGAVRSTATFPILTGILIDSDDASPTAYVEVLTGAGVFIAKRTATLRSGTTNTYDYQTVAADLAAPGTFRHRWYSFDGYLYSGATTVEASATRSAEAQFTWAAVPSVVITSPADSAVILVENPEIIWTASSQDSFIVNLYEDGALWFTSGTIPNSAARSYRPPLGTTRNGHVYDWEVGVTASSLTGYDTATNVSIAYTPPDSLASFLARPSVVGLDPQATAGVISWEAYVGDYFYEYQIWRDDIVGRPWYTSSSFQTTQVTDWHAPDGAIYTGVVIELKGLDELVSSAPVSDVLDLPIRGVVMVSVANPQIDRYVTLGWEPVEWVLMGDEGSYLTWGADAPITKRGRASWFEADAPLKLDPQFVNPQSARLSLQALARSMGFSYRDKTDRRFAVIPANSLRLARQTGGAFLGRMSLRETTVIEGVVEES